MPMSDTDHLLDERLRWAEAIAIKRLTVSTRYDGSRERIGALALADDVDRVKRFRGVARCYVRLFCQRCPI